ncbi:21047_t:CDS:2, partial [Dentiscutata erythropus]
MSTSPTNTLSFTNATGEHKPVINSDGYPATQYSTTPYSNSSTQSPTSYISSNGMQHMDRRSSLAAGVPVLPILHQPFASHHDIKVHNLPHHNHHNHHPENSEHHSPPPPPQQPQQPQQQWSTNNGSHTSSSSSSPPFPFGSYTTTKTNPSTTTNAANVINNSNTTTNTNTSTKSFDDKTTIDGSFLSTHNTQSPPSTIGYYNQGPLYDRNGINTNNATVAAVAAAVAANNNTGNFPQDYPMMANRFTNGTITVMSSATDN